MRKNRQTFWGAKTNLLKDYTVFESDRSLLLHDRCENALSLFPSNSVQLILTDPPYHTTQKSNIVGDTAFNKDDDYLDWMEGIALEWKRILAMNGTIYCYCASKIASRLEVMFSKYFNIIGTITWTKPNAPGYDGWKQKMKKESLRGWYLHSEKIICMETKLEGNLKNTFFGQYLKELRKKSCLNSKELTEAVGAYGRVNNGGAVSNWETGRNIPSEQQYEKICAALLSTSKVLSEEILPYEDAIRPFNVSADVEFTDVWNFENVRQSKGKHPAEKPTSMLAHIIETSSRQGDLVLDCFSGSGSTLYTALQMKRIAIGIELDPKWIHYQLERMSLAHKKESEFLSLASSSNTRINEPREPQLSLLAS